ncbi:hypothetical protein GGQ91_005638 [Methylobacterium fujisawaense]|jgi:hypothetical protein|nr:hypothetical protein [Methylobacterium fujisawaense]
MNKRRGPHGAAEEERGMAKYRFHCTNGLECVFDARGTEVRAAARLVDRARKVASDVRQSLANRTDWAEWRVSVHDLSGRRVLVQPFEGASGRARAA